MKEPVFVGVDPSIRALGFCFEVDGKTYSQELAYPASKVKGKVDKHDRGRRHKKIISGIFETFKKHIPDYKDRFYVFGFEHFVMSGKGRICDMAELAGFLKGCLYFSKDIEYYCIYEIPPRTLKDFITFNGNASKEQMMDTAYRKFGVKFATDNECDAYCVMYLTKRLYLAGDSSATKNELMDKISQF